MTPICESPSRCEFFSICKKQATTENRLTQLPYLSRSDHSLLLDLRRQHIPADKRGNDIEDLHLLFASPEFPIANSVAAFSRREETKLATNRTEHPGEESDTEDRNDDTTEKQETKENMNKDKDTTKEEKELTEEQSDSAVVGALMRVKPKLEAVFCNQLQKCQSVSLQFPNHEDIVRAIFAIIPDRKER